MQAKGVEIVLPTDVVVADKFAQDANHKVVDAGAIPDGWMGLDIGPKSIDLLKATLKGAKTVIWNGPMGGERGGAVVGWRGRVCRRRAREGRLRRSSMGCSLLCWGLRRSTW